VNNVWSRTQNAVSPMTVLILYFAYLRIPSLPATAT
jgi:hypothetical protein